VGAAVTLEELLIQAYYIGCETDGTAARTCGRIYETRGGPEHLRWFWSFAVQGPMTRSDRVATLEEAKAQFQKSWDAWKAWAKLEEVP
jgi:hypothetical protein